MPRHYKTQKLFLHFILNEFIWEDVLREQNTTGNPLTKISTNFNTDYALISTDFSISECNQTIS